MISKFALFISLFLALAAVAVSSSELSTLFSRGKDFPPQPSDGSGSIIPRENEFNKDWAGCQFDSWSFNRSAINFVTVTFVTPPVTHTPSNPTCDVTFAVAIGKPGCGSNFVMVGVQVNIKNANTPRSHLVYATSLDNMQDFDASSPIIQGGDTITLTAELSHVFGGVVTVQNHSRDWIRTQHVNTWDEGDGYPVCNSVAQVMVIATQHPAVQDDGHVPLANFGRVIFSNFSVLYGLYDQVSDQDPVLPLILKCFDIEQDTEPLTITQGTRGEGRAGIDTVVTYADFRIWG